MIRKYFFVLIFCTLAWSFEASSPDPELLQKIKTQLEKNESIIESYDFYQDTRVKDMKKNGEVEKVEKRTYRTILLEGHRYLELIKFDDKALDKDKKKEEAKNREKFLKRIHKKEKPDDEDEEDLTWDEVAEKYEFIQLPPEEGAAYVISFKPRSGKLKERTRIEKVINRLAGTFWVSSDYNIIKASADLLTPVKYGWGIVANVDELHVNYAQNKVDDVWLPGNFNFHFKARILVKNRNSEVENRYYNHTKRSAGAGASAAQHQ
jgi:hypothetical protein